jgi:hypothetical protein
MKCCYLSCSISAVFLIAMVYMTFLTAKNETIQNYRDSLPLSLINTYDEIVLERTKIYYTGYGLGLCLAIIIIFYNNYVLKERLSPLNLVCIIVASAFLVNYFYYILTPKTKWMLDVITEPNDVKAWLDMYKKMNIYYHSGLALGLVAVGAFGYAFR